MKHTCGNSVGRHFDNSGVQKYEPPDLVVKVWTTKIFSASIISRALCCHSIPLGCNWHETAAMVIEALFNTVHFAGSNDAEYYQAINCYTVTDIDNLTSNKSNTSWLIVVLSTFGIGHGSHMNYSIWSLRSSWPAKQLIVTYATCYTTGRASLIITYVFKALYDCTVTRETKPSLPGYIWNRKHTMVQYDNNGKGWYFQFHDDNKVSYKCILSIT